MTTITMMLSSGQPVVGLPLGGDPPRYSGGSATWDRISRPRRKSFTTFTGEEPWTCKLSIIFDAWPDGDVEELIRLVEDRMHRPEDRSEPDLLKLVGPAMSHADLVWVLESVDDSGECQRRSDGRRSRQALTLNFLEYVPAEIIVQQKSPAAAAAARAESAQVSTGTGAAVPGKTYTAKSGDTLSRIAASQLGNANRWQELANLNGIRDPRTLKVGQVLKLP
jgi:hypothetical protein